MPVISSEQQSQHALSLHHETTHADLEFSQSEQRDLLKIGYRLAEYLYDQKISRIVFLDAGARNAYQVLINAWIRRYPNSPHPDIYFINPHGFHTAESLSDTMPPWGQSRHDQLAAKLAKQKKVTEAESQTYVANTLAQRTDETIAAEFTARYPELTRADQRHEPLMVFDTCQHTGMSTQPVLRALHLLGFSDVRLGLASHVNDVTTESPPDFVALTGEAHNRCYPFMQDGLVVTSLDGTTSTKTSDTEARKTARNLRHTIKDIFTANWEHFIETQLRDVAVLPLEHLGFPKGTVITRPPVVDLFYAGRATNSLLPKEILEHPKLLTEAKQRRVLHEMLQATFDKMPNVEMSWSEALKEHSISTETVSQLYIHLANFLTENHDHYRLILYLPFEMLLPRSTFSQLRDDAGNRFFEAYRKAWFSVLSNIDYRFNFVDGDDTEPTSSDGHPQLVHKAAHLIPFLLQCGWLEKSEILEILKTNDQLLLRNVTEALSVAYHQGSITENDFPEIRTEKNSSTETSETFDVASCIQFMRNAIKQHDEMYNKNSSEIRAMSEGRYRWEKGDRLEKIILETAKRLSEVLSKDRSALEIFSMCLQTKLEAELFPRIAIKAVFLYIENQANESITTAKKNWLSYQLLIENYWEKGDKIIKNDIYSGLAHCFSLGVIPKNYLDKMELTVPEPDEVLPINLYHLAKHDLDSARDGLDTILKQPEVMQHFFPSLVVSGSKIKGYPTLLSDIDIIGFKKKDTAYQAPETVSEIEEITSQLSQIIAGNDHWLSYLVNTKNQKLKISYPSPTEHASLSPHNLQSLMGGVWIGDNETVRKLQTDVVEQFLYLSRFGIYTEAVQNFLLINLEVDNIQARLLHRGYRFFYPDQTPNEIAAESAIDGGSAFWDSGFRRAATQIFISRVFLPNLS